MALLLVRFWSFYYHTPLLVRWTAVEAITNLIPLLPAGLLIELGKALDQHCLDPTDPGAAEAFVLLERVASRQTILNVIALPVGDWWLPA